MANFPVSRKLAPQERAMEVLNRKSGCFHLVTISRLRGRIEPEILERALVIVQNRHPHLNYRIVGDLNALRFEPIKMPIPLRIVDRDEPESWRDLALEEMNRPLDAEKGLMRAVLLDIPALNLNYLITSTHHAISDGRGVIQLHSEILGDCQKIAPGTIDTYRLKPPSPLIELMPPRLRGIPGRIRGFISLGKLIFKLYGYNPKTLAHEERVPIASRSCGLVHRKLDRELTVKIIARAKKEGTTVQGALCAAMLKAVEGKIRHDRGLTGEKLVLSCSSAVDLRPYLSLSEDEEYLTTYASALTSFHTIAVNTDFWELARDARRQLGKGLKGEDIFHTTLMSELAYRSLLASPHKSPTTVAITNIGRVDIAKDYGVFQLEEIGFILSQKVFGGVFGASVTTFDNIMLLNFMFAKPSLGQKTIELLADGMISLLLDACR